MQQNPQKVVLFKQFCKKHPNNHYEYICDREACDYYLQFECHECRQDGSSGHSHQCPRSSKFVKGLHGKVVASLAKVIKDGLEEFRRALLVEVEQLGQCIEGWYSPMDQSSTEKQFVHTVENPSKWQKILQATDLKDSLISYRLQQYSLRFRKQMQEITKILELEMNQLKYKPAPLEWKFDTTHVHELLNISGFKDRTVDKKSEKEKYCVAILNQPMSPLKNQLTFSINSQNPYQHFIVLGVCSKRQLAKEHYQTDLKKGIVGIYQAAKSGSSNNALSLNGFDETMHYKEAVGWNFRSGDSITITYSLLGDGLVRVQFKKNKQCFQLFVKKCYGFLHPFVALFSPGDKVSIYQP